LSSYEFPAISKWHNVNCYFGRKTENYDKNYGIYLVIIFFQLVVKNSTNKVDVKKPEPKKINFNNRDPKYLLNPP
jgi:hypothetical protein